MRMLNDTPICDRCHKETTTWRMSRFNTDHLCPACLDREENHPLYKRACDAERAAVAAGDYNFPGIGKPADL